MYLSSVIVQGTSISHSSQFDWDGKEMSEKDEQQMHFCFLCAVDKQNRNWIPELCIFVCVWGKDIRLEWRFYLTSTLHALTHSFYALQINDVSLQSRRSPVCRENGYSSMESENYMGWKGTWSFISTPQLPSSLCRSHHSNPNIGISTCYRWPY